jgi:hypothetical protein
VSTPREIAVADHLWEALGRLAEEMGVDRDALVNQALHALARANGYVVPGAGARVVAPPPAPGRGAVAARVLETAERLERAMEAPPPVPGAALPALALVRDDGAEERVLRDRFVVGRGRHCDLVVDSAKVSREHAAVVREGDGWYIEDLGSSNGTWFRSERITRRRIGDGDEYFVSGERLRCVLG